LRIGFEALFFELIEGVSNIGFAVSDVDEGLVFASGFVVCAEACEELSESVMCFVVFGVFAYGLSEALDGGVGLAEGFFDACASDGPEGGLGGIGGFFAEEIDGDGAFAECESDFDECEDAYWVVEEMGGGEFEVIEGVGGTALEMEEHAPCAPEVGIVGGGGDEFLEFWGEGSDVVVVGPEVEDDIDEDTGLVLGLELVEVPEEFANFGAALLE
jgi:hypothetical protein